MNSMSNHTYPIALPDPPGVKGVALRNLQPIFDC